MISCSLSPNTEFDDVLLAIRVLCMPWKWKKGSAIKNVEQRFGGVTFNSGRSALLAILRSYGIGKGDEVICQAFTCVAVPNSVRWSGATPVFVDVTNSYNLDPQDVERKVSSKTRAIIVQHTFGIPAQIDKLMVIAKKHKLIVIEDFAHTMTQKQKGDAVFYSFGRDKILSSVFGGMAVDNNKNIKAYHKKLEYPSMFWIFQQLLHPIAFAFILPLYDIGIGKLLLVALQRLHLLSFPVYEEEKKGKQPNIFPAKYPNALAILLVNQLKKLERYTKERSQAVAVYGGVGPLLRYPLLVDNSKETIEHLKRKGVLLGNWYHLVVDPNPVGYKKGSCPNAERLASHVVNLPTRISKREAAKIKSLL